jgi:hypothetical protein
MIAAQGGIFGWTAPSRALLDQLAMAGVVPQAIAPTIVS